MPACARARPNLGSAERPAHADAHIATQPQPQAQSEPPTPGAGPESLMTATGSPLPAGISAACCSSGADEPGAALPRTARAAAAGPDWDSAYYCAADNAPESPHLRCAAPAVRHRPREHDRVRHNRVDPGEEKDITKIKSELRGVFLRQRQRRSGLPQRPWALRDFILDHEALALGLKGWCGRSEISNTSCRLKPDPTQSEHHWPG